MADLSDEDMPGLEETEPNSGETSSAVVLHPTLATAEAVDVGSATTAGGYATQESNGRFRGLSNQGATCYLNSLLQSLYMTPEFRAGLYEWTYDEAKDGPKEDCIPYQLQSLFGRMQLSKLGALDTKALTASFGWGSAEAFQQQDVQELCRVLFDRLEDAFKDTPNANLVNDLYQGRMVDYLETIGYPYTSNHPSEFLDISLQVKPFGSETCFRSVDESLRSYLAPEKLEGDNQYYCEDAQAKLDAIKGSRLEKLPYLLTLQLKRFDLDYATVQRVKLNDQVRFPRVLNMNPFVPNAASDSTSGGDHSDGCTSGSDDQKEGSGANGRGAALSEPTSPESGSTSGEGGGGASGDRLAFEQGVLLERERLLSSSPPPPSSSGSTAAAETALSSSASSDNLELPDLVDVSGVKHPDMALEAAAEAAAKAAEKFAEDDEEVNPVLLVERDGEWVYELYAVLIHSGSAMGGHYYAYIKDMVPGTAVVSGDAPTAAAASDNNNEDDTDASASSSQPGWYHFNDSSVTSMHSGEVRQAWGGNGGGKGYGANAYMLMYRKVDPSRNQPAPGDDAVPSYVVEACKEAEAEALAQQELKAMRDRQLDLKMVLAGTETEVSLSHDKYATVRSLKVAAAQAFGIQIQGEFDAVSLTNSFEVSVQAAVDAINDAYASCGGAALSDLRLREMSLSWKVPSKHLNSEGIESGTLADINLYSHKTLYLEVAPHHGADFVDDGWVEDGIWARVSKYDPNLPGEGAGDGKGGPPQRGALAEPISVCISKSWMFGDARAKIAAACGIANTSRCRVLKKITYTTAVSEVYVDDEKALSTCYWYDGIPLWCEELPEGEAEGVGESSMAPILCLRAFENASYKLPLSFTRLGATEVTEHMTADSRWSVATLRKNLAQHLGLAPRPSSSSSHKGLKEKESKATNDGSDDDEEKEEEKENSTGNENANAETNDATDVDLKKKKEKDDDDTEDDEDDDDEEEEEYDFRIKVFEQTREIKGTKKTTLKQQAMFKDMKLQLSPGRQAQEGEFYWKCFLLGPSTAVKGAQPGLAPEPSPAEMRDYLASADAALAQVEEEESAPPSGDGAGEESPISSGFTESNEGAVSSSSGGGGGGEQKEEAAALEETKESKEGPTDEEKKDAAEEPPSTFGFDFVVDQPSMFDFNANFFEVLVRPTTPVSELRRSIWKQLVERGLLPVPTTDIEGGDESSLSRVRVREKVLTRATKAFRDGKTVEDSVGFFGDNRELAVQVLDAPEHLAPEGSPEHGVLAWVRRWHRSTQSLGAPQEVLVRASERLEDFNARLAFKCGVSHPKHARVLRAPPYMALKLQDLSSKTVNDALGHTQGVFYNYYATAANAAAAAPDLPHTVSKAMLNLQELNTDMLVVMDISEPLNPLTASQQSSLDLAKTATSAPTTNPLYEFTNSWSYPTASTGTYPSGGTAAKPKEFGVRIKTRQEREADAANNDKSELSMKKLTLSGGATGGSTNAAGGDISDADLWGEPAIGPQLPLPLNVDASLELQRDNLIKQVDAVMELD